MTWRGHERERVRARAGLVLAVAFAVGCGGKPPKPDDPGDPKPDPRTAVPQTCMQDTWCDVRPADPPVDTSTLPLWGPLECGPVYRFHSGIFIGTGSLCADSPGNRQRLRDDQRLGFRPGGCAPPPQPSRCLNVPDGMVFVIWERGAPPPFCPSSCKDMPSPSEF